MIDEHAFAKRHAVAEVAGERRQDAHIVELAAEQLLEMTDVAWVVGQGCVRFRAQRTGAHHLVDRLFEVRFAVVGRTALVHQFVYMAFAVFHHEILRIVFCRCWCGPHYGTEIAGKPMCVMGALTCVLCMPTQIHA